jgi:hypothetical protein
MSEQPADLSQRVISLAREIDRLPPGEYSILVIKPDLPALSWHVVLVRQECVRTMELPRREIRLEVHE